MKKIIILVIALFAVVCSTYAQNDTLYIMKSGEVTAKYNISDEIDSIIFYSPDTQSSGTEISFDASKILTGDLEGNGNYRFEIYNEYGSGTASDSPINQDDIVFSEKMEVTFTLSGVALADTASGSYPAYLSFADADWDPQVWGDNTAEDNVMVTGDGIYTLTLEPGADCVGAIVWVIDIYGMAAEITDIDAVTGTITKIVLY